MKRLSQKTLEMFIRDYPELDVASILRDVRSYLSFNRHARPASQNLPAMIQRWLMREKEKLQGRETPWQKDLRQRRELAVWMLKQRGLTPEDFGMRAV